MKRVPGRLLARAQPHYLRSISSSSSSFLSHSPSSSCSSSSYSLLSPSFYSSSTTIISFSSLHSFPLHYYSSKTDPPTKPINYSFKIGAVSIPHPSKIKKGGEDAHFISSDYRVIAVADGVGGWGDVGVDPALYSKALMEGCKLYCADNIDVDPDQIRTILDPVTIMDSGYNFANKITGSSTCCICVLDGLRLRVANLGDSGFTIVRNGKVYYSSYPQQHAFNFPYQLGAESADLPEHAEVFEKDVEMGDVVVAATDGVFDNLSPRSIAALISRGHESEEDTIDAMIESLTSKDSTQWWSKNSRLTKSPAAIFAERIARHARVRAEKRTGETPFSLMAQNHGYDFKGGKLDDITVVVGIVSEADPPDD